MEGCTIMCAGSFNHPNPDPVAAIKKAKPKQSSVMERRAIRRNYALYPHLRESQ